MKHHIIVKFVDGTDVRALEKPVRSIFEQTLSIPGIRGVDVRLSNSDRPNRYDMMIVMDMDKEALSAYDARLSLQDDLYFVYDPEEDTIRLHNGRQSAYATATVADTIDAKFRELEDQYPGLRFVALMDQGDYIHMAMSAVVQSLLLGGVHNSSSLEAEDEREKQAYLAGHA